MRKLSLGGAKYFITFTDDKSRWTTIKFLKKKSESLTAFKEFKTWAENTTGQKIKNLQSDNGGEYTSKEFTKFLKEAGIGRRLSCPDTPQQNGIAERI
ncbi:Hypothetical protein NTJ_12335 [Nesidiocoris tenuis]|nr:Hypothetical protein NTJ_12335 [Nesidiocoris tenuis]